MTERCFEEKCGYQEPHRHGFACNWGCSCNDHARRVEQYRQAIICSQDPVDAVMDLADEEVQVYKDEITRLKTEVHNLAHALKYGRLA